MAAFTIDMENDIIGHVEALDKIPESQQVFTSEKELAKLAAEWPASRLIDVWNSFAGVAPFDDLTPVKKFTSRQIGVQRIWGAVARLSPAVAPQAEPVAPPKGEAKRRSQSTPRNAPRRESAQTKRRPTRRPK